MRLPLRSWKNTLGSLGLRLVERKSSRRRKPLGRTLAFETLEQRQLLSATVIDNEDEEFTVVSGQWSTSLGGTNGDSLVAESGGETAQVRWSFDDLTPGQYRISTTWAPVGPASATDITSVQAELTQGWPTDGSSSAYSIAQVAQAAVVRDVNTFRANAETFVVDQPLALDKIWVQYASRFNGNGFRMVLFRVDDPLAATLETPESEDPAILIDDTVQFSEIAGAVSGTSSDTDKKYMAIDVEDVQLAPGAYALQFFSTGTDRTFKWVEQYGSDVGGDRYDEGDRQTDDSHYRFALETTPLPARSTAAPFEVFDGAASLGTVLIDQLHQPNDLTETGTKWEDLGIFVITVTTASVELSDAASGAVIADAVRLERIADLPLTILLASPYASEASGTMTGTVTRAGGTSGNLVVTLASDDTTEATVPATVTILDGNATAEFTITLQDDSVFDATQSVGITATASSYSDGQAQLLVTDEGEAAVVDNGDTDFTVSGSWTSQPSPTPAGYQTDIHSSSAGTGADIATWAFFGLPAGTYRVSATWSATSGQATNATYEIYDTPLTTLIDVGWQFHTSWVDTSYRMGTRTVDQTAAPTADIVVNSVNFQDIGTVTLVDGTLVVRLADAANGQVVADAVRIELLNHAPLGTDTLLPIAVPRDLTESTNHGFAVQDLIDRISVPDGTSVPGIALIASDTAYGTYQYSLNNGNTWADVGEVDDDDALLLLGSHRMRFLPEDGFVGTTEEALTLRAWSGIGGEIGARVDTGGGGAGTPFAADSVTVAIQVTPAIGENTRVNDFDESLATNTRNVSLAEDGRSLVTWHGRGPDGFGLYGQWTSSQGSPGDPFQIVEDYGSDYYSSAITPNGAVVLFPEGNYIRGRLVSSSGTVGSTFSVTSSNTWTGGPIAIASDSSGNFTVAWQQFVSSAYGIVARRFNSSGTALASAFTVAGSGVTNPSLAMRTTGAFIVAWDNGTTVYAQRYTNTGSTTGSVITVGSGYHPAVAVDASGEFVVAYSQYGAGIAARRYNSSGTLVGSTLQVSVAGPWHDYPSVASDAPGNFVIAWQSRDIASAAPLPNATQGIQARWYDASGASLGDPTYVNTDHTDIGDWSNPQVVANARGEVVAVWNSRGADGSRDGIFMQRFQMPQAPVVATVPALKVKDPLVIDLAEYFGDRDLIYGDGLTFSIDSNNQPTRISPTLDGGILTLERTSGSSSGLATIVVRATDVAGNFVTASLAVTAVSYTPPTVASALEDLTVSEDAADSTLSLAGVFSDPGDTLTYSVIYNSNSDLVIAAIVSGSLVLDYQPNQHGIARITVQASDSTGMIVRDTISVSVDPVNDAPTLVDRDLAWSLSRGTSLAENQGYRVSELVAGQRDVDAAALQGIALIATDETQGIWQFSLDNGATWQNVGEVSESNALLLAATESTRLRFRPSTAHLDTIAPALTFRAWDQSFGSAGQRADVSENGGASSYSSQTETMDVSITPALGEPFHSNANGVAVWQPVAIAEDGSYVVAVAGIVPGSVTGLVVSRFTTGQVIVHLYDAAAQEIGSPIEVVSSGNRARVVVAQDGSFLVIWNGGNYSGSNSGVHARWYSAAGAPQGAAFEISGTGEMPNYDTSSVDTDTAGNIVVGWQNGSSFYVGAFESDGDPLCDPISVGGRASVAVGEGGVFAVAWQTIVSQTASIKARLYDFDGDALSDEITVSSGISGDYSQYPIVAVDSSNRFAVTWIGRQNDLRPTLYMQWYNSDAEAIGEVVRVSDRVTRSESMYYPNLTRSASGTIVATWFGSDQLTWGSSIYVREFQLPVSPVVEPGIDDVEVDEDAGSTEIDLEAAFSDGDVPYRDWLTYSVVDNDAPALVTASVDGGRLLLNYAPNQNGVAEITVRATDWFGYSVEDTFLVIVNPVNDAPTGSAIPSFLLTAGESFSIDLKPHFSDVDDDAEDLVLSIAGNSNSGLFSSLSITDGVLSGTVDEDYDSATITIRATDTGSAYGETTLVVGAYTPSEDLEENGGGGALLSVPWAMIDEENIGSLVSDIIQGLSNTANSTDLGIAIYQVATSLGTAEYSLDGGDTWQAITGVSATSALLLSADADTRVRFRPNVGPGAGGAAAGYVLSAATSIFSYVGWDMSSGTAGQTLNLAHQGNQTTLAAIRSEVKVQQTMASMEFVVNTTTSGDQARSQLAMAPDGRSVIAWYSDGPQGKGVYAQRFNADGTRYGGEVLISSTYYSQLYTMVVRVLIGSNNTFVVATSHYASLNAQSSAEIKRFNWNTMAQVGNAISFSGYENSLVLDADINDDHLVIVRQTYVSSEVNIVASVYDANQNLQASVNVDSSSSYSNYYVQSPKVAIAADSTFVAAWTASFSSPSRMVVYSQRYAYSESSISTVGTKQTLSDLDPETYPLSMAFVPAIRMTPDKRAVVFFQEWRDAGAVFLAHRIAKIATDGSASASFVMPGPNTYPEYLGWTAIHVLDNNKLLAVGSLSTSVGASRVVGQHFELDGDAIGERFDASSIYVGYYQDPDVAGNGNGAVLIAWDEFGAEYPKPSRDGNSAAVVARHFGPKQSYTPPEVDVSTYREPTSPYNADSDSVGFKPHQIYTRPISVETKTGHVIFRSDLGPDTLADSIQPVYRQTSDSHPIVSVDYVLDGPLPDSLEVKLTFGNIPSNPVFYTIASAAPGPAGTSRVVRLDLQAADVSALPTGHYNYKVEVIEHHGEEVKLRKLTGAADIVNRRQSEFGVGFWLDSLDRIITGADDYYGEHDGGGNGVLLARGDGTAGWFAAKEPSGGVTDYISPAGSFTKLVKNSNGTFTLTHPDGTKDEFTSAGLLDTRTDRHSNVIKYEYIDTLADTDTELDQISTIRDIYGLTTVYAYDSGTGFLDTVTDFAERTTDYNVTQLGTTTAADQAYYVTQISEPDPDGTGTDYTSPVTNLMWHVSGTSDGSPPVNGNPVNENPTTGASLNKGLLKKIVTPGVQTDSGVARPDTVITYDTAGRFHDAKNADGTHWQLVAQDVSALPGITVANDVPNADGTEEDPLLLNPQNVTRAVYTNERGTATTGTGYETDFLWDYTLDRFGYETSTKDPLNNTWQFIRNSDGLMTRKIEPKGAGGMANFSETLTTKYAYDAVGNLLQITYPQTTASTSDPASALITETWQYYDDHYYQLKKHTDARGYVTDYVLRNDHLNTAEIRQQVGSSSANYEQDKADPTKWTTTAYEYTDRVPVGDYFVPAGLVSLLTVAAATTGQSVSTSYEYYHEETDLHFVGLLKKQTAADGTPVAQTTYFTFDSNHNPSIVTNNSDVADGGTASPTALERTIRYEYDRLDRLHKQTGLATADHAAPTIQHKYDPEGNEIELIDTANFTTEFKYDKMSRLTLARLPLPAGTTENQTSGNPDTIAERPETKYVYDAAGNLKEEHVWVRPASGGYPDPPYQVTEHEYNARNELVKTSYPSPGLTYAPGTESLSAKLLQNGGEHLRPVVTYVYDAVGNLKWQTDPRFGIEINSPVRTEYTYDAIHRQTKVTSPAPTGQTARPETTTLFFDDGRVKQVTSPGANGSVTTAFTYDGLGQQLTQTDHPSGGVSSTQLTTTTTFDGRGNVKTVTQAGGGKSRETKTYYDELDRVIAVDGPDADSENLGVSMYYAYNAAGEVAFTLEFAGNVLEDDLDSNQVTESEITDRVTEVWGRSGRNNTARMTTFVYDKQGQWIESVGPDPSRGAHENATVKTTRKLDVRNNVIEFSQQFYDALEPGANLTQQTLTTVNKYDALGRLWKTQGPVTVDGVTAETQIAYNLDGTVRQQKIRNPNDVDTSTPGWVVTSFAYDGLGRLQQTTTEDVAGPSFGYVINSQWLDAAGHVVLQMQHGEEFNTRYDAAGLVRWQDVKTAGGILRTEFSYTPSGQVAKQKQQEVKPQGQLAQQFGETAFVYDDIGRVKEQRRMLTSGTNATTKFEYDAFGVAREVTDPQGNVTVYTIDNLARTTQEQVTNGSVSTPTRTNKYDSFGNVLESKNRKDEIIEYTYDNQGHRTREKWAGVDYAADYVFSALGELKGAENTDASGSVANYDYWYDADRRLETSRQAIRPLNAGAVDFVYEHDLIGNVKSVTSKLAETLDAEEFKNTYQYDNAGRLKQASQVGTLEPGTAVKPKTVKLVHTYFTTRTTRYDNSGPTGTVTASTTEIRQPGGAKKNIQHFRNDGSLSPGEIVANSATIELQTLEYDPRGLLKTRTTSSYTPSLPQPVLNIKTENQYDRFGQLEIVETAINGVATAPQRFQYDANGNPINGSLTGPFNRLSHDTMHAYEYDAEGNLQYRWTYWVKADSQSPPNDEQLETVAQDWKAGTYRITLDHLRFDDTIEPDSAEDNGITVEIRLGSTVLETIENMPITWNAGLGKWVPEIPEPIWFSLSSAVSGAQLIVEFNYRFTATFDPDVALDSKFHVDKVSSLDVLTWDRENRLTSVTNYNDVNVNSTQLTRTFPVNTVDVDLCLWSVKTYTYDALDRPIAESFTKWEEAGGGSLTETNRKTAFVWERDQRVLDFVDGTSSDTVLVARFYAPGVDNILAAQAPATDGSSTDVTMWGLKDYQGSTIAVAYYRPAVGGGTELFVERVTYNAQGFSTDLGVPPNNVIITPARHLASYYTGREHDFDTGFDFFRGRIYDPAAGRFVSEDPIGFAGGDTNLYRFGFNSFGNMKDPSGHSAEFLTAPFEYLADRALHSSYNGRAYGFIPDGGFYQGLGQALYAAAPEHFANASALQLVGETALFSTALVTGGYAVGGVAFAGGSALGFANGLVQTYVSDPNAGITSYAFAGSLGALFGGLNPLGGALGLGGTLGGAAAYGRRGAQIGGMLGDLLGAGVDDVFRAIGNGAKLGSAVLHAAGQTAVTGGLVAGAGWGTYKLTGNADTALLVANLASLPANVIGRIAVPCFPAGTRIFTRDGLKVIEELQPNDEVASRSEFDDGTGPVSYKEIEEIFVREGRIFRLQVAGHAILVTPEHPFFIQNQGWTPAEELKPGDLLSTLDGRWLPVDSMEDTGDVQVVYNFRVADYHTYFVAPQDGDGGVWVHNAYAKPILGRPAHGGSTHNGTMVTEALSVSNLPGVTGVRTNQALVDTAGNTLSLLRPDVQYIEGGLVHVIEVNVSRGAGYHDIREQVLRNILGSLFGSYKGI